MPHTHTRHGSSGDDLGSTDEVKIFKDEGDHEDEKISSENLLVEEKSSLIDLTESEVSAETINAKSIETKIIYYVQYTYNLSCNISTCKVKKPLECRLTILFLPLVCI